ncbi:MAG: hypothetical protein WA254_07510, partial [Candidatus Sulfotelmatobacter sp.]
FNLPQHRHDLLWLVPLDGHDPLFLQVDSLSFHLVQISPVTSLPLFFGFFSGGFTLSTSAITSLNGSGMCGIGLEFVILFWGSTLFVTFRLQFFL